MTTTPGEFATGDDLPTLGARIRARNPQRIANNPWTTSASPGLGAGFVPPTGTATDSAERFAEAKGSGSIGETLSYEEAKALLS